MLTNQTLLTLQPEKEKPVLAPTNLLQPIKVVTSFLERFVSLLSNR